MDEKEQVVADVLITGYEGGIGYWARAYDVVRDADGNYLSMTLVEWENAHEALGSEGLITNHDALDAAVEAKDPRVAEFTHQIDLPALKRAANKMLRTENYGAYHMEGVRAAAFSNPDLDPGDADTADLIIQHAALGQSVYG